MDDVTKYTVTSFSLANGNMLDTFKERCELYFLQIRCQFHSKYSSMSPDTVTVCFETDYVLGKCGRVGVTGSLEELGAWEPTQCVLATVHPAGSDHWRACATLPCRSTFKWKWIIVSPDRGKVWRWEEREDRESYSGTLNGRWTAPWNGTAKFTPERVTEEKSETFPEREMPLHIVPPPISVYERFQRAICTIL